MADPEYFFDPKADIFDPIAQLLEERTSRKSYFLEPARNHEIDRWDWKPIGGSFDGPAIVARDGADNSPRLLADVEFRCEITCRGKTYGEAWRMAQQFASAQRRIKFASGTIENWSNGESSDQPSTLKTTVVLTVVWVAPFLEQSLGDDTEKVTIKSVDFDTSSPDYGVDDGTLRTPLG